MSAWVGEWVGGWQARALRCLRCALWFIETYCCCDLRVWYRFLLYVVVGVRSRIPIPVHATAVLGGIPGMFSYDWEGRGGGRVVGSLTVDDFVCVEN